MKSDCVSFTINGKCSGCGQCCTELIPLTYNEVKLIRAYVKEKQIQPYSDVYFNYKGKESVNLMCPFRDFDKRICKIYEVKPKICRVFKCDQDEHTIVSNKKAAHNRAKYNKCKSEREAITNVYSTRELIYGDSLDTIRILIGNLVRMKKPVFTEGVIKLLKNFGREDIATEELVDKAIKEYNNHDKKARGVDNE